MKIKALKTIIEFDGGQMVVINAGETGELSDDKAQMHIDAGAAAAAKGGKVKAEAADAAAAAADDAGATDAPAADAPAA